MRPTSTRWRSVGARTVVGGALILASLVSCQTREAAPGNPVVRDATGATVVENDRAAWPDGHGWRLSEQPVMDIGVFEGDSNYQFDRVRGVVRLSDGRIVVANAGTEQLRFFSAAGEFVRAVGGKGGGPGEFDGLLLLRRFGGDSLLTFDSRQRRLSIFDPDGEYVRSVKLEREASGFPNILGLLPGNHLLVSVRGHFGEDVKDGLGRDSTVLMRFGLDGKLVDTTGVFPGTEWFTEVSRHADGRINTVSQSAVPFARFPATAVAPEGFYFGANESYEIRAYGPGGELQRIIRLNRPNVPLTPEAHARFREDRIKSIDSENGRRAQERMFAKVPFPSTLPAYSQFLVDAAGHLWVGESRLPGDTVPRWTVIDSAGTWLGPVKTPPSFSPYQIGMEFVLGVWWDENGVEHVRMYGLKKEI